MKRLFYYYLYLFLVWGSFRIFVELPEVIEELWFKPVIWIVPLFWWNLSRNKERLEMFKGKGFNSLILGLSVGLFYLIILRGADFSDLLVSSSLWGIVLATSITEELVFSGFVAGYLAKSKSLKFSLVIVSLMVALLRLPILIFVYEASVLQIMGAMLFVAASGAINAWIRLRTGNVTGSIVARLGIGLAVLG